MIRTQVQLPEPLYREVKRVAALQDWSVAEVLRRGAEHVVRCFPPDKEARDEWTPPAPRSLGPFLAPVERWRDLADDPHALSR